MLAPLSWLRDYAPLDAEVDDLATALSELGLVVEGVDRIGAGLGDVVVSRVLSVRPHPDADRIRLVDVDGGGTEPLQIVCGAWNFEEGDLVPLAPVGAVLPGGFEIGRRKMRGEWSNGMLCSSTELELPGGSHDGLLVLPAGLAEPGTPLVDALGLQPDVVFDLDISPNRPDALCMAGVARDLAAVLGEPFAFPSNEAVAVEESLGRAPLHVEAGDLCPRFTATIMEGAPDGPSPAWIARRLTLAGMRPINAVVDVSNYVMLDLGQPNHAYDLEQLGGGGILVRRGSPGEVLVTLDGVSRSLGPDDCVICDASGTAVGVGGIMGGAGAEIGPATKRVLLEAAWFAPVAIAKTGKRLGLHSEARVRFERGVDPQIAPTAVSRFVSLLASFAPGVRCGPTVDAVDPSLPVAPRLRLRTARVNSLLGTSLANADIPPLIEPIGFGCSPVETGVHDVPGAFDVTVPSWRLECTREVDVVEEVARMWGYRKITRTLPGRPISDSGLTARQRERRRIRQVLTGAGFDEAWTTTFLAPGDLERAGLDPTSVEVENPLDRSESILRSSLLPGLLKAVRFNADRQAGEICLFELGTVFFLPSAGTSAPRPDEEEHLAVIVAGLDGGTRGAGTAPLEASVEAVVRAWLSLDTALRLQGGPGAGMVASAVPGLHPGRSAKIAGASARDAVLGAVGEVDPAVVAAYGISGRVGYLSVSLEALAGEPRRPSRAFETSRYPAADVDLAFVVGESVPASAVASTIGAGGLVESVELFDVYRGAQVGDGQRSLAFRVRFRAGDRTLGEGELATARQAAIDAVVHAHAATLRG